MQATKELDIMQSVKTIIEGLDGYSGNVFINFPQSITRKKYCNIIPIDAEYSEYDGAFNIMVSITHTGGTIEKRLENIITDKNNIRKALQDTNNLPAGVRYIQIKKENYTVDINKNVLYLTGVDMEFEIGIVNEGG